MSLYQSVRDQLTHLIEAATRTLDVETTPARQAIVKILLPTVPSAMSVVEQTGASGSEKKQAVLAYVREFYDRVIEPIDLPGPDKLLDPLLREFAVAAAGTLIDVLAEWLKSSSAAGVVASFHPRQV